ncbi:N-alpha-acetyltransferase 16, NatA auxiliary subunit [Sarcoptes scabiei]|uniref:N-alpha-acetyltransferase 16, NatA auxiliary subunit n=1 Tax=Sarcoptes scabiei TaxID=52283 RepID=A0A132AA77_SARSC|nr:N-alpha-acetyltransferase 16, NatA auxiliary subunit [Sarcoptes scabiei]KPM07380.1 NMDA receptor-regulated protein-like protein [Sarcoptes scabiei]
MSVNTFQPTSQTLPSREASLFKKILKHFKEKQFKNGLKICNQILSNPKFSEHGETLSMKGLILNSMGKKSEALEFVRRGLKNDVKSHVCWHVFGLLQKADHKYEEAIKCYRNALRLKKDSIQILSDLSLVQIQTRDLEGYRDSRYQLFCLRPGERSTWLGCAMAYHLTGDHMTAVNILSEYQNSTSNTSKNRSGRRQNSEIYEHSELLLYHIFILLECDRNEEALNLLDTYENEIVDKVSYYEYKCRIFLTMKRFDDAQTILLEQLIKRNPENAYYFELLEQAKQVLNETDRLKMYEEMSVLYPRSQTLARLPMNFVTSLDLFRKQIDSYLKNGFRKSRPALFRNLKNLYNEELRSVLSSNHCRKHENIANLKMSKDQLKTIIKSQRCINLSPKLEIIENLLLDYLENLSETNSFDYGSKEFESATCILWVYYFLAQHFDALKEFSLAIYFVNQALIHTPTLIDIFVIKAKIFKHAGLLEKAVQCLEEAQSLDTSDRYLNSKCAKYLLRINKIKEAEDMCSKFTREGVSASENLNEMQCMWFQNEVAKAYQRMEMFGLALTKCIQIDNHFAEISEDQFDFNTYCILKVTLRAYVKMIRLEDRIKSHRFFITAAKTAIEIYLSLYDNPIDNKSDANNDTDSNLSASELRKIRNKQRKAMLKATAQKENDKSQKKVQSKKDNESRTEEIESIDPIKLERTENPLSDVSRFLNPVKIFGKDITEIQMLAFEVYYRRGKLLLQLQCLKRSFRTCEPNSKLYPSLLTQTILFLNYLISLKEQLNESICSVLDHQLSQIDVFGLRKKNNVDSNNLETDVNIFSKLPTVEEMIRKHLPDVSDSFLIRVENLKVKHLLNRFNNNNSSSTINSNHLSTEHEKTQVASEETKSILKRLIDDIAILKDLSLENCLKFYESLKSKQFGLIPSELLEELREKFHLLFPLASLFMNEKQFKDLEKELSANDYFTFEPDDFNNLLIEDN